GMFIIADSILQEGDEAIVFDPVDFLFRHSTRHAGGVVVEYPVKVIDGKIDLSDLENYITPKTKMIGLCNPHNPLGLLYTKENLQLLLDLAEKHDLYIMNDEIWSNIVYPEKPFLSLLNVDPSKNDRVLSVFGWSKTYCLAGLRIGCVYTTNRQMFDKMIEKSDVMSTAGGVSTLSQIAGMASINYGDDWFREFRNHLTEMRDYGYERLNHMPKLSCTKPEGTYMFYVNIKEYGMNSNEFCEFMKKEVKLALIPGGEKFFGSQSEGYIRICFATSKEILEEGLNRLEKGLELLNNK
ncbi:MAG: pyridoxal phosphate-dependent aminotransferase, partial [Erysipelotrichaceae bacterium]|nr:pyridoxal phosphate-dependent aminotransferase [Erysipelotrichaceae bacterium]